nr:HAMP domain-containing sensor histidine kinase [uncultured Dongia sp.]
MTTYSLRWRIVWPLIIVLAVVMIAVTVGLFFYLMTVFTNSRAADEDILPYIAMSIQQDSAGQLRISPTPELSRIQKESRGLWFVALAQDNREIRYGQVPDDLETIAVRLGSILDADIRAADDSPLTFLIARMPSSVGEVRIMFGGRLQTDSVVVELLKRMKVIYLPFLAFTLIAAFLSVPILVKRALAGLSRTTDIAASIDIDRRGQRLPLEDVPEEMLPLVAAINAALERLDHGYTQQRRFLADAAHELRTPIAILYTNLEAMPNSQQQRKLLNDVGRLANTAEQLLDLHRMDNRMQAMQEVDLVQLCKSVVGDLAPNAIAAGYELSFSADRDRMPVVGDGGALERVVANLVTNAIEHGGGKGSIRVIVSHPNVIEISDDGPGIPPDQWEDVFEPFYRISPKRSGAGLGLNLVKQIVQRHNGQVSIAPSDHGARFRISLNAALPQH